MKVKQGDMVAMEGPNDFRVTEVAAVSKDEFVAGGHPFRMEDGKAICGRTFLYARPAEQSDIDRYEHDKLLDAVFESLKRALPLRWSSEKLRKVLEALK